MPELDAFRQLAPLTDAELQALFARLDEVTRPGGKAVKRGRERTHYRVGEVALTIHQPGGGKGYFRAYTRDLSGSGIGLLYGGFLHERTIVDLQLMTTMGEKRTVRGRVTACRHIAGKIHGVGITFLEPIEPRTFIDPTRGGARSEGRNAAQYVGGTLLHLDDEEMDRELLRLHFRETKIQIMSVCTIKDAVAILTESPIDMVICDLNLQGETGEQAIRATRDAGFSGPLLILSTDVAVDRLKKLVPAGATGFMQKPYEPPKLLRTVLDYMAKVEFPVGTDPIFSLLEGAMADVEPVAKYIDQLASRRVQLRKLLGTDQIEPVRQLCGAIQSTAKGYGFPMLADVARIALKKLDGSGSVAESRDALLRMDMIMSRIRLRGSEGAKARPAA
jgi:two-component system chemotaxis response regulator CheY